MTYEPGNDKVRWLEQIAGCELNMARALPGADVEALLETALWRQQMQQAGGAAPERIREQITHGVRTLFRMRWTEFPPDGEPENYP